MKKNIPLLLSLILLSAAPLFAAGPASGDQAPAAPAPAPARVDASSAPAAIAPVDASTAPVVLVPVDASSAPAGAGVFPSSVSSSTTGVDEDSTVGLEYFKQRLLKGRETMEKKGGPAGPLSADLVEGAPVVGLTLQETIEDVVFTNPAVEKARLEWLAGLHAAKAAWGEFEPDVVGEYKRGDLERQNTALEVLQQVGNPDYFAKTNDYKLGIEGKIFTGTAYNIGTTLTETKDNFAPRGEAQTFAGVTLSQPLFKGLWFADPLSQVRVGKIDRRIAFHTFRTQLMRIIYETEAAYWALSYAEEKHRMAKDSVEIARKLVRDSEERVKTGKMSPLDLVEAQAGLADRKAAEADARQEMVDAVNRLKVLLSTDKIRKDSWVRTTSPMYEPDENAAVRVPDDMDKVLRVQPDYQTRRHELEKAKASVDHQRAQSLPELDLNGSYGYSGLAANRDESWDVLKGMDHHAWTAGVELRAPILGGYAGRNLTAAERLREEAAEEALSSTEYDIVSSLAALRRRVVAYRERIDNAREVVSYRKRLLDVEFVRLDAGKSNARVIYDAEEKLAEARKFELESLARYQEAESQVQLVSGTLLADKGFERVEPDGGPVLSEALLRPRR